MYDSKRLIPAPFVSIEKQYTKTNDGTIIGKIFQITIIGTLVAYMGSPSSTGTWHTSGGYPDDEAIDSNSRLAALLRKQEALRELFSNEGLQFEVQSLDGSQPMKCNPRQISISIPDGQWFDRCEYTITMECDELYPEQEDDFSYYISDANESWQLETNEDQPEGIGKPRTYRLTHNVSAVGKRFYDDTGSLVKPAWQQARDFVLARLGFDSTIALSSGVNNLPSYYGGYNHVRSQDIDELGGGFSVSETWILSSGTALEDFTVETNSNINETNVGVTIQGLITGLEERNASLSLTTSKYDNALTKFTQASGLALTRAQSYSGYTLNITPTVSTIGRNPIAGTIQYSFQYDDRPSSIISGAKSEVIAINDSFGGESFASIFVLGRANGPVLQDLGTKPAATRSLNIECVMPRPSFGSFTTSEIRTALNNNPRLSAASSGTFFKIIEAANPQNNGYTTVFESPTQENWEPLNGRYSYNKTWTYE